MFTKTTFKFIFIILLCVVREVIDIMQKNPPSMSAAVGKKPAEKNQQARFYRVVVVLGQYLSNNGG